MVYRNMKKEGVETSLLGYGCMRFPTNEKGTIDREESTKLLLEAYDKGINYFDTAYPYHNGESEKFVGEFFATTGLRDKVYIATKLPCWDVRSLEDAERIFAEQLEHLKTDHIDFYLLHALHKERFDEMVKLGVVDLMAKYKEEGKIINYGFSFHDNYEAFEYIAKYRDWDFCQIQLNYMDTEIQAGMKGYRLTEELGIPVVIMEPAKGGSLTTFAADVTDIFTNYNSEASVASWAFRWVASLPNVKVVLSGMTKREQLEDNLKTFDNFKPLSDEEHELVKKVVDTVNSRIFNGCTGCRYCVPCPGGVMIPQIFKIWNEYGMYNNAGSVTWKYFHELPENERADKCLECGACQAACPQGLSIIENLKTAHSLFQSIKQY